MTATETWVCANCTRERPKSDVFWHVGDRVWYCQDVQACEARWEILRERTPSLTINRPLSGQSL